MNTNRQDPLMSARFSPNKPLKQANMGQIQGNQQIQSALGVLGQKPKRNKNAVGKSVLAALTQKGSW